VLIFLVLPLGNGLQLGLTLKIFVFFVDQMIFSGSAAEHQMWNSRLENQLL
jgi:hypothetical protein